jgi:hypothetical protein
VLRAISGYIGRHHVALLALFFALCGTSFAAANYINGTRIKPGSIPANRLAPAATASLAASDLMQYCRTARARPRSYSSIPCLARTEAVDGGFNTGGIALGSDGNPVIIHASHPIELVRCNDPICAGNDESVQEINGTFCGGGGRLVASLAITPAGLPIVAQKNGGCVDDGILNIVRCKDPSCAVFDESGQSFDVNGNGDHNSIAIGADGNPVVSYYDNLPEGDLKVLHCNDPACDGTDDTINVVAGAGDVGQYTSLAIGKNGNPVIAYYDVTNHDLKVARCNDQACAGQNETISTVESTGDVGEFASLAVGTDGNPVIAYYKRSTGDLRVARCNDPACAGGNEKRSTVASTGDVGQWASLGIGLDGRPAVAFYDVTLHVLKLARCNDAACTGGNERVTTLDAAGDAGQYASLAIGVDGVPLVAYLGAGNVKVARPPIP